MKPDSDIPPRWVWHHRALTRLRDALVQEREEHGAAFREPVEHGGEDAIDIATELREHADLLAALRAEDAELVEIEAALGRIRKGTYGICEATGRPIAGARLRAIPWTRFSTAAARKLEQAHAPLRGRS